MGIRAQGNPLASFLDVWSNTGLDAVSAAPIPEGLTATGGIISDYTSGSDVYRSHIFTSSGTFDVTAPGGYGDTVEYLVVAGGGGAGGDTASSPVLDHTSKKLASGLPCALIPILLYF